MTNRTNDFEKPISIADGGTGGTTAAAARTNLGIILGNRTIEGTPEQIAVTNGSGLLGNPVLSFFGDAVMPGTGAVTAPRGTTGEQPGTPVEGMVRGNTDTGFTEIYSNGFWRPMGRDLQGTSNEISVSDGDGIAGDPTVKLADDTIMPGTGAVTVPGGTALERPGAPVLGMIRYNTDINAIEAFSEGAWASFHFIRNTLTGFVNTVASVSTMSFSAGQCSDSTNTVYLITSSAFVKDITANWAQGTGNGGFPSALTLSNNTVYYTFAIAKADGTIDFGFDTDLSATNLLSDASGDGFTHHRRIGSCRTQSASTDLETIYQIGNYFYYQTQKKDYSAALGAAGTTDIVVPLSVPAGIDVIINLIACSNRHSIGSGTTRIFVMPATTAGIADNFLTHIQETSSGANEAEGISTYQIPSNDGTVRVYSDLAGNAAGNTYVSTFGWFDMRGQ